MKAGKLASLVLVAMLALMVAVCSMAIPHMSWIADLGLVLRFVVLFAFSAAIAAALLVPIGSNLDQTVTKLREDIDTAAQSDEPVQIFSGPKWLAPMTRSITNAVEQFRRREESLRMQLREVDIRHRVSETERRNIEAVLHSLRDGVIVTDAFNEITMANDAAADLFGFDLAEAMHKSIDSIIKDRRLLQLITDTRDNANFVDLRRVEHEIEHVRTEDDGEETKSMRVFETTLSSVENHKNEVGGVVLILHDMTRERELSQMKSEFVSKASHELRTPLSSIRAYVEMLVDGEATDEESRREFYQVIQNESTRLGRLIDNMLNISRIEAGIVQIEREEIDMTALINRAIETLEPQAHTKNMTMSAKTADVDLTVEGDNDMLYQVLINLISNAIKYSPEGGRITVSADTDNLTRSVVVTVADTGLGIPPDALPKLFDKFYRVETFKRVAQGTGLGLNLCKHIVERVHYGQIGVKSQLGMGSKFWFSIPMRYAGSQAAA